VYSSKDSKGSDAKRAEGREQMLSRNSSRAQLPKDSKVKNMTQSSEDLSKPSKGKQPPKKQFMNEREALKAELRARLRNPGQESDEELPNYETSHDFDIAEIDHGRVKILQDFGYPEEYIHFCVKNNEANYCSAGYYMLAID